MRRILASLAAVAAAGSASAQGLLTENFDYANGNLVGNGGWIGLNATGTNPVLVSAGTATLFHASGTREDVALPFSGTDITSGKLFASFSFSLASAPTTAQDYFLAFTPVASSNFYGRVFIGATSPGSADYRIGITEQSTTGSAVAFSGPLTINTTYVGVLAVDIDADTAAIYLGTSLSELFESTPTVSATDTATTSGLARIVLRQGSSATTGAISIDNLLVGTTFASVTGGAIPEPAHVAFGFGALALAGVMLRRRR